MMEHEEDTNFFNTNEAISQEQKHSLFYTSATSPEQNIAWGDNLPPKPANTRRLYFQNINGLQSTTNWNKWRDIVNEMSVNQVDIMGLAETNINWNQARNKRALTLLRTQYKHSILLNATSDETSTSFHKPGGASLAILSNAVGTISQKYIDETGLG